MVLETPATILIRLIYGFASTYICFRKRVHLCLGTYVQSNNALVMGCIPIQYNYRFSLVKFEVQFVIYQKSNSCFFPMPIYMELYFLVSFASWREQITIFYFLNPICCFLYLGHGIDTIHIQSYYACCSLSFCYFVKLYLLLIIILIQFTFIHDFMGSLNFLLR